MIILIEMFFIVVLGCILHFTYEWTHHNKIIGWFSAVNESTWEHIKLAILPGFLTILLDYWFLGENQNYWFAKFLMLLFLVIMIPAIFYLSKAVFKRAELMVDIMIFCLAIVYSILVFNWVLTLEGLNVEGLGLIGCGLIFIAFAFLTYFPFKNFLFMDPCNEKYGFDAHECHKIRARKHKK